jgi:hypothetical protein
LTIDGWTRRLGPYQINAEAWTAGNSMHKLIVKYPVMMLVLIWATLLLAVWIIPNEPRPGGSVVQPARVSQVPPGMAAVRRLAIIRHRPLGD